MNATERIAQWLDTYQFSLGSLIYMISQMMRILAELGNAEGVELAEEAKAKHERAQQMQYDWDQQKKEDPLNRKGTQRIDNKIDSTLSKLADGTDFYVDLEEEPERMALAEEMLDNLFPRGIFVITSKPFDDQHAAVDELLTRLRGNYAEHVEKLHLESVVSRLERLNEEFGEQLKTASSAVSYDEVESAYVEAEDAFHRLFVQVLADYSKDIETLNRVLEPVHTQTERTRRSIKSRGSVPEVDPETGEPVEPIDSTESDSNRQPDGENQNDSGDGSES